MSSMQLPPSFSLLESLLSSKTQLKHFLHMGDEEVFGSCLGKVTVTSEAEGVGYGRKGPRLGVWILGSQL